ncbi:DUF3027 domain-containing protein [Streptomyces sp. 549]|uniref:DUF3027 domain-containing protein n=1 Tax=Streptomyces sp. 549 TaxID=3049076 RepID=UPI0024C44FCE|nr:DUF3027 domain-containing protein [Streptomyces sp. 549]MDK1472518.1 DUF3027 domain-containing protein [Streptomyces sp. 549]
MRSRTPDRLCAEAVELAREAAVEAAHPRPVGEHLGTVVDGDRVVTHLFACREPGYRGWHWAVTVARASRAKLVTVDETVLLPGTDALLAPQWLPWSERLRPGDMGPGDLLPADADDLRLEPGFSGEDAPPPNSPLAADEEEPPLPRPAELGAIADELGMGRPRVLSRFGLHTAADRWEEEFGPKAQMAQSAPASCMSCGFLVPLTGSLRQAFGVCANEYAPADGRVVSLAYGCGAHSEAAVMPKPVRPPEPVVDENRVDAMPLHDPPPATDEDADGAGNGPDGSGDKAGGRSGGESTDGDSGSTSAPGPDGGPATG